MADGTQTGRLYPQIEPYRRFYLDVGDGHELYVELCGNPSGKPVLVLHGGPGAGSSPYMRRFFDPDAYHVVLFDQRGAGKSKPTGELEANTTWHLVDDIERLRTHLDIRRWQLFGGSWGSTLALLYAQAHPERVSELVLRGIFTMSQAELDWFYGGGAARFFPQPWAEFVGAIPEDERDDLIGAYHRRLTSDDIALQTQFARVWVRWETATAVLRPPRGPAPVNGTYARAFARIESHFFAHNGWLATDDQILGAMQRIASLPGRIVQGRYDVICPPHTATAVADRWPTADLVMIDDAGHALSEPGITAALIEATDSYRG